MINCKRDIRPRALYKFKKSECMRFTGSYSLSGMLNSNKAEIFLRLRICGVTLRGFPSTGSLRASHSHRTSCNFDFHARYARKSRKLRAHSHARVKLRTGYWISFLKTFVTAARSANPVGFEVDSALHKMITYQ